MLHSIFIVSVKKINKQQINKLSYRFVKILKKDTEEHVNRCKQIRWLLGLQTPEFNKLFKKVKYIKKFF